MVESFDALVSDAARAALLFERSRVRVCESICADGSTENPKLLVQVNIELV